MEKEEKIDWTHLPNALEAITLWGCLHDGQLLACESNLEQRSVQLTFSVDHLVEDNDPDRFFITIGDVTSVRANLVFRRLGDFEETFNTKPEERTRLVKEYQEKWREESIGWPEFESLLSTDPLEITDAEMVQHEGSAALRLGGFLNGEKVDDLYSEVFIRGAKISASRSNTKEFALSDFIELGNNYWKTL